MIKENILPNTKNKQKNILSVEDDHSFKTLEESNEKISVQLKKWGMIHSLEDQSIKPKQI